MQENACYTFKILLTLIFVLSPGTLSTSNDACVVVFNACVVVLIPGWLCECLCGSVKSMWLF